MTKALTAVRGCHPIAKELMSKSHGRVKLGIAGRFSERVESKTSWRD